jgi:hypothetical protein
LLVVILVFFLINKISRKILNLIFQNLKLPNLPFFRGMQTKSNWELGLITIQIPHTHTPPILEMVHVHTSFVQPILTNNRTQMYNLHASRCILSRKNWNLYQVQQFNPMLLGRWESISNYLWIMLCPRL